MPCVRSTIFEYIEVHVSVRHLLLTSLIVLSHDMWASQLSTCCQRKFVCSHVDHVVSDLRQLGIVDSCTIHLYGKYGTVLRSASDEEATDGGFGGGEGASGDGGGDSLGSGGGGDRRKPTLQRLRKVSSVII